MCLVLWFFLTLLVKSLFKKPLTRTNPLHLPPSPPALPIIGHLHLLGPSLYKSLHNLSTKYGLSYISALMLLGAFLFQHLTWPAKYLIPMTSLLQIGRISLSLINYRMETMDFSWHPMLIMGVRQEEIALFLRKVFECAKKKQVVDVGAEQMKLTNNITCRMMMSMRCSDESDESGICWSHLRIRELVKEAF